ncbi:MAG: calcium/sodium antiporter [Leptolyngbyaceae bacterium]|nr:calcium/sodium antiporter [Leptolyngbyaceae bacterium]
MSIMTMVLLIVGLGLIVAGAEVLVRGASQLAAMLGISPLVIGLTVVAYGTSAPEMAVSIQSAFSNYEAISIGNIVGSNIFNVLFILGLSASITPLFVAQQLIKLDVPIMIGVSLILMMMGLDYRISRVEGIVLVAGAVIYTAFLFYQSMRGNGSVLDNEELQALEKTPSSLKSWCVNIALIAMGILLLTLGSRWLVDGAVAIATAIGVSQLVIGLTLIALGTSLPEAATSVVASLRGERDIAVGNVVGSNIFNILAVLGVAGCLAPNGVDVSPAAINFDIPVMVAVAVACLPIFFTGNIIRRWEGALFLGYYAAYTAYLILDAINHDSLPVFSRVLVTFVIPLTVVTFVTITLRYRRQS